MCDGMSSIITGSPQTAIIPKLKALKIIDSSNAFCLSEDEHHVEYQCPAEYVIIEESDANVERQTLLLSYIP